MIKNHYSYIIFWSIFYIICIVCGVFICYFLNLFIKEIRQIKECLISIMYAIKEVRESLVVSIWEKQKKKEFTK